MFIADISEATKNVKNMISLIPMTIERDMGLAGEDKNSIYKNLRNLLCV